jgi:hypothetical protein
MTGNSGESVVQARVRILLGEHVGDVSEMIGEGLPVSGIDTHRGARFLAIGWKGNLAQSRAGEVATSWKRRGTQEREARSTVRCVEVRVVLGQTASESLAQGPAR